MSRLMSDTHARVTAMAWQSGQDSALYSFGSTGAISESKAFLLGEISLARDEADSNASIQALADLNDYVLATGPRGPQPTWAMTWDPIFEKSL